MTAPTRVDLHCHWVANIDDGARSPEQGLAMLCAHDKLVKSMHAVSTQGWKSPMTQACRVVRCQLAAAFLVTGELR